ATSSDISSSVTWTSRNTATVTVSPTGLLSGVEVGNTTVTATKDGVTSNTVNVSVCADLAGACIDVFDIGTGKLFTNSPSVAYLDSVGGSPFNTIDYERPANGPDGNFYLFDWSYANTLCTTYSANRLGGRTNWRLATKDELRKELFDGFGPMFTARGWPTYNNYWSKSRDGSSSKWHHVLLNTGIVWSEDKNLSLYASCVSNP
ncbi:Ig-like domain-containing protein, partial [Vibrio cholerae]|uniref:Ig-like domain-containing protein n=1 Tax=Vibrio cholerae TaxID=666 RepID=UPI000E0C6348